MKQTTLTSEMKLKTFISTLKDALEKDADKLPTLIKQAETDAKSYIEVAEQAILYSMIAEMYHVYYNSNAYVILDRSEKIADIPDRIEEWNSKQFQNKIRELITLSLEAKLQLSEISLVNFEYILDSEQIARGKSVYEFLLNRAIEIDPTKERYETLLTLLHSLGTKERIVTCELEYLRFLPLNREEHYSKLDSLSVVYNDGEHYVEIVNALLGYMPNDTENHKDAQYELCKNTIEKFPNYARIAMLRNRLAEMIQTELNINIPQQAYPKETFQIMLEHRNIESLNISISNKESGKEVANYSFELTNNKPYINYQDTFEMEAPKAGVYLLNVKTSNKEVKLDHTLYVSRLTSVSRNINEKQTEIIIADSKTGKLVKGATAVLQKSDKDEKIKNKKYKSDKYGIATLNVKDNNHLSYKYWVQSDKDIEGIPTSLYPGYRETPNNKDRVYHKFITDRSIYRPGQSVYFKGIAYKSDSETSKILKEESYTIILKDANNKEIARQEVRTNVFGSFEGKMNIPKNRKLGLYTLQAESYQSKAYFEVAEYKRPTLFLELDQIEEARFDAPMQIKGTASLYSGSSLSGTKVYYSIERRPFWMRYSHRFAQETLVEDTVITNENGEFVIPFTPSAVHNETYCSYKLEMRITDAKGETQELSRIFSAGRKGFILSTSAKERELKEDFSPTISARTPNGTPFDAKGTYKLIRMESDKHEESLADGSFESGKTLGRGIFASLPSGKYLFTAEAKDKWGQTVYLEETILLYSPLDKRPPIKSDTWLASESKQSVEEGENVTIRFGTSCEDVSLLYEVFTHKGYVLRKIVRLDNEVKSFVVPFLSSYGEEAIVSFSFFKEGKFYEEQVTLARKKQNLNLEIKPITFRDELTPGSKEQWSFQILNDSIPFTQAEVLASMYDASLDAISPFAWRWYIARGSQLNLPRMFLSNAFDQSSIYEQDRAKLHAYPSREVAKIDWQKAFNPLITPPHIMYSESANGGFLSTSARSAKQADNSVEMDKNVDIEESSPNTPNVLRTDFQETAFFYPNLSTDSAGKISFDFALPESNTKWKLQLLAHGTQLQNGIYTAIVQSSKPLMVTPNKLRFAREGDRLTLSTMISNQSQQTMSGRVSIELFNPSTNQPIVCLSKALRPFELEPKTSTSVSWNITIPNGNTLIGCRIIADSEQHSDGEQYLIPILPNKVFVTKATPFYLTPSANTHTAMLGHSSGLETTTLEISNNPVWEALKALPQMKQPVNNSNIALINSFQSVAIVRHLLQTNPQITNAIRVAAAMKDEPALLQSELDSNQELKNILTNETPWLMEAQNQTQQIQQMASTLDDNHIFDVQSRMMTQLQEMQNADGGWSWFGTGSSNAYVTTLILCSMADLVSLGAISYNEEERLMIFRALAYMDKQIANYHMLETKQQSVPYNSVISYLYVRAFFQDIPVARDSSEAFKYYIDYVCNNWQDFSLNNKVKGAIIMQSVGKVDISEKIFEWFRKTATSSADKGMYWANNKRKYSTDASPIETHTLLINLFSQIGTKQEVEKLKQWLLLQKRSQSWENNTATIKAVYALFSAADKWASQRNEVSVFYAGKELKINQQESPIIGYSKNRLEINPNKPSLLSIENKGTSPAWGAVYQQSYQTTNQVKSSGDVLSIRKEILNSGEELKLGDKVTVRLVVDAAEEMNYVHIKDMREACFEPSNQLSQQYYKAALHMHAEPKDASENFFIERLPAGIHVIEYDAYVSRVGEFNSGIATIQCLFAPEYVANSSGITRIKIEQK